MFSNPFFTSCFQTPKSQSQQAPSPSTSAGASPSAATKTCGSLHPHLPGILSLQQNFNPSSPQRNIFLVTYPKSGTTWLKALTFAISNRPNNTNDDDHPLLSRHPQDCSPYLEGIFSTPAVPNLDIFPPTRILGTHIPCSILPDSIKNSRIVYLCREPKDTLVSMWHFANGMRPEGVEPAPFKGMFELFCDGVAAYGPVWDHQLEYWKESLWRPQNVLFLKYEEMEEKPEEKPEENVRRLAEFMGQPFTEEEERW